MLQAKQIDSQDRAMIHKELTNAKHGLAKIQITYEADKSAVCRIQSMIDILNHVLAPHTNSHEGSKAVGRGKSGRRSGEVS